MRSRENLADHVKDRVILKGITNLFQLFEETLEHPAFDGVGGNEVKDEAVLALAVAMDAAHPLFKAVGVPRDVIIEEHMAALEVDAIPGHFRSDQDLNIPI